jgi:ribosomal protein L11 methyltransferase
VSADYWALVVTLDPEAADAVANFLWEAGAAGVVEEEAAGHARLRAFFPPGSDPPQAGRRVTGYLEALRRLRVPVGPGAVEVTTVPDEAWAEAWREHFRPLPVGHRLLVAPPWAIPADADGRVVVVIEPGRAFGTGSHATTHGCLELLERALAEAPAARVLDVGTGSGILAIAAARLGVPAVVALDVDPEAVAAAAANAARNGVAGRVRVEPTGAAEWTGPPAPLVLANLLGATLIALAPDLARACARPGRLVAGGLLAPEAPAVAAAFARSGFALAETVEREGWASLLLVRLARGGPDPPVRIPRSL